MARDGLLHSSTVDAWSGNAFHKSQYTVWENEREFVEVYIAELGTADRETIRTNINLNRDEFEQEPDYKQIIGAVMAKVGAKSEANWPKTV